MMTVNESSRPRFSRRTIGEILLLHILIFCFATDQVRAGTRSSSKQPTVLPRLFFVSVPSRVQFLPLLYIAEEFASKGYNVSFALPEDQGHWIPPGIEHVPAGKTPKVGLSADFAQVHSKLGEDFLQTGRLDDLEWSLRYHDSMYKSIEEYADRQLESGSGRWPPAVVVTDRYTLAGIDVAHRYDVPFVVHNPFLLLDIDDSPLNTPAPFAGTPFAGALIWQQVTNLAYWLRFRLAMADVARKHNNVRAANGLPPLDSRQQTLSHRMVLTGSVFGLEHPRPLPPLQRMVGLVQPGKATAARRAKEQGLPGCFAPTGAGTAVHKGVEVPRVPLAGPNATGPVRLEQLRQAVREWLTRPEAGSKRLAVVELSERFERSTKTVQGVITALQMADLRVLWCGSLQGDSRLWDKLRLPGREWLLRVDSEGGLGDLLSLLPQLGVSSMLVPVITTGDLQPVQVALRFYHPLIVVPLHHTQHEVAVRVARMGVGLHLQVAGGIRRPWLVQWAASHEEGQELSPESLRAALMEVVSDHKFARAVVHYGTVIRGAGGLKEALAAVAMVANFGTERLVPQYVTMPWYKVMMLDVYYIYLSAFLGVAVVFKTFWATCWATLGTVYSLGDDEAEYVKSKTE